MSEHSITSILRQIGMIVAAAVVHSSSCKRIRDNVISQTDRYVLLNVHRMASSRKYVHCPSVRYTNRRAKRGSEEKRGGKLTLRSKHES